MADNDSFSLNLTDESAAIALMSDRHAKGKFSKRTEKGSKKSKKSGVPKKGGTGKPQIQAAPQHSSLKGYDLEYNAEEQAELQSQKEEKAASKPEGGKRQKDRTYESEEVLKPDAAVAGPEDSLMEAIALSMHKDTKLATGPPQRPPAADSDSEEWEGQGEENEQGEGNGVVSFVNENYDHTRMMKRKKRVEVEKPQEPATKKRKGLGNVHPKTGELTHASEVVPEALRAVVLGDAAASTFAELGLAESLSDYLEEMNFKAPTRIQQQCIPVLLAGRDALVNAPTGSGKTLAYLAPVIDYLQSQEPRLNRGDGTFALVLVPTRELAVQIQDVLSNILRRYFWLICGAVTGGENRGKEKARLRKGVNVVVATPGRLLDHLQSTTAFHTNELKWLILDEADRLLDLGFEKKIRDIVATLDSRLEEGTGKSRQTVLLSATMDSKLDALVNLSLRDPVYVGFSEKEGGVELSEADRIAEKKSREGIEAGSKRSEKDKHISIPDQLQQRYIQIAGRQRLALLAGLLCRGTRGLEQCKMVVFVSSCDGVEFLHQLLQDAYKFIAGKPLVDCPIFKLHGSLTQRIRTQTFLDFSRCSRGVLICTDVAARGLDFPDVTCIVQYDPPGEVTEYVHRVGRTARMGQVGEAILFLLPSEMGYLEWLAESGCKVGEMNADDAIKALPPPPGKFANNRPNFDEPAEAYAFQTRMITAVSKDAGLKELAGNAFRSFVRAYATHPSTLKEYFHVKKLHLGHVAHSFALKDAPTMLGKSASKAAGKLSRKTEKKEVKQRIKLNLELRKRKKKIVKKKGGKHNKG